MIEYSFATANIFLGAAKEGLLHLLENYQGSDKKAIESFLNELPDNERRTDTCTMRLILRKIYLDQVANKLLGLSDAPIDFLKYWEWYRAFYCGTLGDFTRCGSTRYHSHILECK